MNEEEYSTKINNMEEYNVKWLQFMRNVDTRYVQRCPEGHTLVAYVVSIISNRIIIACPNYGCNYYDYNTFSVPAGTQLAMNIEWR